MKRLAILILAASAAVPAFSATDIGVSIGVYQPGVYGRIDIGNAPPPPVIYTQPVVIAPTPYAVYQRPVYLYVPVEHQRHWQRYCGRYAACGQPVYFVQERWVQERWEHAHPGGHRGWDKDHDHDDHGHGHGQGHGHGHDHDD